MESHQPEISQFCSVTGIDYERAKFFLESANWDLNVALSSFYDEAGAESGSGGSPRSSPGPADGKPSHLSSSSPPSRPKIMTMDALKATSNSAGDEEGQAFFAGGSEHSGQQVLGPPRKSPGKIIEEMFRSAREQGAEEVMSGPSSDSAMKKDHMGAAFIGTGMRLGQTSTDHEPVPGALKPADPKTAVLQLWKEGFSVDGEALRDYSDPSNKEFLESIRRGEIPQELIQGANGGEVHLNMEDHRDETYTAPKVIKRPFTGKGHLLGSPAPPVIGATGMNTQEDKEANEEHAKKELKLKDGEPVTTIQVRLADGTRLIIKANHSHTVDDICTYIFSTQVFGLYGGFPSKELVEGRQTLKEANLLNALIIQRL
ncbi:unnamed protein product, partial [Darwinula stevensoni]